MEGETPFFADKSAIIIIMAVSSGLLILLGILTFAFYCCFDKKNGHMELQTVNVKTRAISPGDDTSSENTDRDHMGQSKGTFGGSSMRALVPSDSGQANTSDRGGQSDRVEFHPDTRRESDKIRSKKAYVALGMP